jgi:hypothetical protein
MMRIGRRISAGTAVAIATACGSDRPTTPIAISVPLYVRSAPADNLGTHLTGDNEVPPNASLAQGQAIFRISDDGSSVTYKLIAANIDNPFMAHIHIGAATVAGPIVEWLFPSTAPVPGPAGIGRFDGVLAEGTFTAADLVGPLKGHPLSDLLTAMRDGGAYVNVHTKTAEPAPAGPGNLPAGEIRGQLSTPGAQ